MIKKKLSQTHYKATIFEFKNIAHKEKCSLLSIPCCKISIIKGFQIQKRNTLSSLSSSTNYMFFSFSISLKSIISLKECCSHDNRARTMNT